MKFSLIPTLVAFALLSAASQAQEIMPISQEPIGGIKITRELNANVLAQRLVPSNEPRLSFVAGAGTLLSDSPATASGRYVAENLFILDPQGGIGGVSILNNYDLIESGVVLSTGDVKEYETGPNENSDNAFLYSDLPLPGQLALLQSVAPGAGFYDVSNLDVTIDSCVAQRVVIEFAYGSDEWDEFIGPGFTDIFAVFVDGSPIDYVRVNDDNFQSIVETELDGVEVRNGTPLVRFIGSVPAGQSTLTFIISDVNDEDVDSTVYLEPVRSLADYDQDGSADFFDLTEFSNDFSAGNLRADLNGDGILDQGDINIMAAESSLECP